ncbi:DUF4349 domain-containing protein [Teredinibacter purpureus]|uniref:DUF4349 domain-containing protein n=1 Tax=Teredinibacter purpureus TaxID=2731756 RepID=UPI0005F88A92|nr:DUF4349 domain-containing protein [Teredinibacter purpureus]
MLRFFKILPILIALVAIIGCSANSAKIGGFDSFKAKDNRSESERYIIRSASIDIEVNDINTATDFVNELVSNNSGFIMSISSRDETLTRISLKVPEPKLDNFIVSLGGIGKVTSQSISSRDVTEEIIDIDARVKNLHMLRDRYRELLKSAKTVTEIVGIEKELADIQSELDRIEGRRKLLMGQVEMSEVNISLESRTIYGPLGYVSKGVFWVVKKLFIIK